MHSPVDNEISSEFFLTDLNLRFNILLRPDNANEKYLLDHFQKNVVYESEVAQVLIKVLRQGDLCIDVGANVGFFTLLMSRLVGDAGEVWAFEPGTNVLPQLRRNLKLNKITNTKLFEQVLWSKSEKLTFYLNADSHGGNSIWDPGMWPENRSSRIHPESYEVQGFPLDSFDIYKVKLLKIDTEGAEQRILEGAEQILRLGKPSFVITEFNPFGLKTLGCSPETMRAYMRSHGYDCFLIHRDGALPSLVPPKATVTFKNGTVTTNVLFSTVDAIGEYWRRVPYP